jgi:glycosyltransferase involved in cell wall biosynthesis
LDSGDILNYLEEIRLFAIVRNESLRLPHFFNYYTKMGVDRFFIIDNGSTDETVDIALRHPNTHVFQITESYKEHWDWMEFLLGKYGKGRWCIVVDADELFAYPFMEHLSLSQLISYLENNHFSAMKSILLDIYSDLPVSETNYLQGEDPISCCSYFDPQFSLKEYTFFDKKNWEYFNQICYSGGLRSNFFGSFMNQEQSFCLNKFSLFKYGGETYLVQGMHAINGANIADVSGAVFHSKFLNDFIFKAENESKREEHFNNAVEYKNYKHHLDQNENMVLKSERSEKYEDSLKLIDLKIMSVSEKYRIFWQNRTA